MANYFFVKLYKKLYKNYCFYRKNFLKKLFISPLLFPTQISIRLARLKFGNAGQDTFENIFIQQIPVDFF